LRVNLVGLHVDEDIVVLIPRRLALPVLVGRIAGRQREVGATGEDRILLGAAAAEDQVLHTVDLEQLGRVDCPLKTTMSRSLAYAASTVCGFWGSGVG